MSTSARRTHYSYRDYLELLDHANVKLEYCDGEIYAMAGGTPDHARLSATAIRLLGNLLPPRCAVFSSDLKVRVEASDLSTFPDATVVCGPLEPADIDANAAVNPSLLVEVTSRSTEDYDRGDKLGHYRQIPSLVAVLLISHRRRQVTIVERREGRWTQTEARAGDHVVVEGLGLRMAVDELYAGVELSKASAS